jgi:glycosyltransferase involved in cell wall biosynthesis
LIVAFVIATEGQASALDDVLSRIADSVDSINLIWQSDRSPGTWIARFRNLKVASDGNLDASRLRRGDYCLLLKEGLIYPAGYIRRMIAAYDDIAVERKIVGTEGIVYSDFFDGQDTSRLLHKSDDPLDRHCLVNQLGLAAIVFRGEDIAELSIVDLTAPLAGLNLAVQCFRKGIPQICIARGQNWIGRHRMNFGRAEIPSDEDFTRGAQELAGFGRLPIRYLDGNGHVPTHTPRVPGRPIANENFNNVSSVADMSLERMGRIAPGWFVDFLGSSHEFAVSIAQSRATHGLQITIDRAARALRLLTPLDPSAIGTRNLGAEIVLRGASREEMRPIIDGVYLVTMNDSKKLEIVGRFFGSITNDNTVKAYSAELKTPRIDPQLDLFFCIQLSTECRSIDLTSAALFEIGSPSRLKNAGAPNSPEPLRKIHARAAAKGTGKGAAIPPLRLLNPKSAIVGGLNDKPKMAVICCSLGQNALGRAHTIGDVASQDFDVELLGTLVPHHDSEIWLPMRDSAIPIRGFAAKDMATYLSGLRGLPSAGPYNVVCVSKPRLHSLLLGMILSERDRCPLVLDADDLELAFLQNQTPLTFNRLIDELQIVAPESDNPAGELWTRYCDTLARDADAITAPNEALAGRFNGSILRHARDESKFIPDEGTRRDIRHSLGMREREKVVLFLGTPRDHKGLMRVAQAIVRRADPDLTMCVIGADNTSDPLARLAGENPSFIRIFGPQPFARLPDLIQCADAVCLLQDAASGIAAFQSPAKMGEALAMGLPTLVSRVPPFAELIAAGIVIPADTDAELQIALDGICDGRFNLAAERQRRIAYFLSELSIAANVRRLRDALETASANFPKKAPARSATLQRLAALFRERYGVDILQPSDGEGARLQAVEIG